MHCKFNCITVILNRTQHGFYMKGIITWSIFTRWFLTKLCLYMSPITHMKLLNQINPFNRRGSYRDTTLPLKNVWLFKCLLSVTTFWLHNPNQKRRCPLEVLNFQKVMNHQIPSKLVSIYTLMSFTNFWILLRSTNTWNFEYLKILMV